MSKIISDQAIKRRGFWIHEIQKLSGNFGDDFERLESVLKKEVDSQGAVVLTDHLRLCGNIPECYKINKSEEKLYSKYTDCLLSLTYEAIGLESYVLKERANNADVEVIAKNYSFVADAKAFRLSRTAKNAKDFKVSAMHGWKRGKEYAMVVCPIYQLPHKSSRIYLEATTNNICIITYSHLAVILSYAQIESKEKAQKLLHALFQTVFSQNPSDSAVDYWTSLNKCMLGFSKKIDDLWSIEKRASSESIDIAKDEALTFLAQERERMMRMSHKEVLRELLKVSMIENKINYINSIVDNGLFIMR